MKKVLLLIPAVIVVIVGYWLGIIFFIPELTSRGLFGDSFGALNTIFSGIALIGVVIALYLQQKQLKIQKNDNEQNLSLVRAQLEEMHQSFILQYQPVLQFCPKNIVIDKPSIFTEPKSDEECMALSRYHLPFKLQNVSNTPAVDCVVASSLLAKTNLSEEKLRSVGSHFQVVAKDADVDDAMMFAPDKPFVTFLDALTNEDAEKIPTIGVTMLYRNLTGGCFKIDQAYYVMLKDEKIVIENWQSAIVSFPASYKSDLRSLKEFRREPSRWHEFFDDLKLKYSGGIDGPESIDLEVIPCPGAYSSKYISESEYSGIMENIGFSRITFAHTKCLIHHEEKESE